MKFIALLLGVVIGVCQAAVLPIRQAPTSQCTPITIWNYIYVTRTLNNAPETVTILQQDPHSVASSRAAIDTIEVQQQSEEAPVSNAPDTVIPVYTETIVVPGYEATELTNVGTSVFYMSKGPSTTDWSFTPTQSITVGTTTVTVVPFPRVTSVRQDAQSSSETSLHTAFTSPYGGWNESSANSSVWSPALAGSGTVGTESGPAYGYAPVSTLASAADTNSTNVPLFTSTITEIATVYVSSGVPTGGYAVPTEFSSGSGSGYGSGESPSGMNEPDKRQTCVWISAIIGGQEVGWCNNWGGRSTLPYTTWETTTTPGVIAGPGTTSGASPSSPGPGTSTVTPETSSEGLTTSSALPTPSACGEVGPFLIGFDDLPVYYPTDNNTADFPPIFNPYDYFYWGDGWAFVPPPNEPFPPESGNRLAQYVPSLNNTVIGSPGAGSIPQSSFGAGPRNYDDLYWFTAHSAYVGCDNGSRNLSVICDFVATAYQWDDASQTEIVVATQHFRIPPCPDYIKCQLTEINFNYLFYKMSTLSFYANVQGKISQFWIDSLSMDWYNNTCAAGLERIQSKPLRLK